MFVVEWGRTKIDLVNGLSSNAPGIHDNLLGVVLNKADTNAVHRYEGYGSYYHNKYYHRYGSRSDLSARGEREDGVPFVCAYLHHRAWACGGELGCSGFFRFFGGNRRSNASQVASLRVRRSSRKFWRRNCPALSRGGANILPPGWSAQRRDYPITNGGTGDSDGDRSAIEGALSSWQAAVRASLVCSPADPFLWLGLFWLTNTREGFNPHNFAYLRLSYELGPNEGWIALKRSQIALAMFGSLPDDIKEKVVVEFLAFVKTGLTEAAADIFIGPGWQIRDVLLARMQDLDEASRRAFAESLQFRGYDDVSVPGVDRPERHPWQH